MSLVDALREVKFQHALSTNEPLVILFSHSMARNEFVRQIEKDMGAPAGTLRMATLEAGRDCEMYDGIEFRVRERPVQHSAALWAWR